MLFKLLLLFTIVPLIELSILIQLGQKIGIGATLAIVILTGMMGAYLAREQGFITLSKIRHHLRNGQLPADPILDGVLILCSGLLLVTPGLITDIIGFLILIPSTRKFFNAYIKHKIKQKIDSADVHSTFRINDF